jgi:hypothetical protein
VASAARIQPARGVFLNVPFDRGYRDLFNALVFTIHQCGFVARCALEMDDGSQVRLDKLYGIIGQCRYEVHDLSRVTLDSAHRLPRFNMPLELGIFLGAKRFGGARQRNKRALILERDQWRYQIYCSDIAGQDIRSHNNDIGDAIRAVRNWLHTQHDGSFPMPGHRFVGDRFVVFEKELPAVCQAAKLDIHDLTFLERRTLISDWLALNRWAA